MRTWARGFALVFFVGFVSLAASLALSAIATGTFLADQPFLTALRAFGVGLMAAGLTLWIVLCRTEAGKTSLNPLFGFLVTGGVLLLLLGLLFPQSGLSTPARQAGLGFTLSALVLGLIATIFSPAYPQPLQKQWPGRTVLTRFAHPEEEHTNEHSTTPHA